MENERKDLVPLERLAFAPAYYVWDETAALKRVQQHLGWGALSEYSLSIDYSGDPQTYSTYSLLVADIVNDQPMVVPAALRAARQKAASLEGTDKEKAETVISYLETSLEQVAENPPPEESSTEERPDDGNPQQPAVDAARAQPQQLGEIEARAIVDRLAGQGKIIPSMGYDSLTSFMAGLCTEKTVQIEGAEPLSPVEYFTGLMEALPCLVPVTELATATGRKAKSYEQVGHMIAQSLK